MNLAKDFEKSLDEKLRLKKGMAVGNPLRAKRPATLIKNPKKPLGQAGKDENIMGIFIGKRIKEMRLQRLF